jgi:probable HAF family extracellular repeat protein
MLLRTSLAPRLAALFTACCASIAAHAAPLYQATLLESIAEPSAPLFNDIPHAYAISNTGVVGYIEPFARSGSLPAYWSLDGKGQILPVLYPAGTSGINYAYNINNQGLITGRSTTVLGTVHAYVTKPDGIIRDLGALPLPITSDDSNGQSVNASGAVVGESRTNAGERAFLWTADGGMRNLGTLAGGTFSSAHDINDAGVVVGMSETASGRSAFVWTEQGGMRDLGQVAGGINNSTAEEINAAGQVVGYSQTATGWAAFSWTESGGMKNLGMLAGKDSSFAQAVNASGLVVGFSGVSGWAQGSAFLWSEQDGMLDLNNLLLGTDPLKQAGLTLDYAADINDNGQILVSGMLNGRSVQAILTPVPEPSTAVFMLLGGVFLLAARSRRGHVDA